MPTGNPGWLLRTDRPGLDSLPMPGSLATSSSIAQPPSELPWTGRTIVLISRDYPPQQCGGIATFVHSLAHALHAQGQRVHVVAGCKRGLTGLENDGGVLVHRICERGVRRSAAALRHRVPRRIWRWSASAYAEVARLAQTERIDVVEAPIWACEGIAFLLDRRWPLATSLHTTLHTWMQSNPRKASSWFWRWAYGRPMLALETLLMTHADAIRANSHAILREIEDAYRMSFSPRHTRVIPHGLLPVDSPGHSQARDEAIELLFVGRLEQRKGIGVLLQALPALLERWPQLRVRIIGDTRIRNAAGRYDKDDFLAQHALANWLPRVVFEGKVSDESLQQAYADCDIFVGPSLFESFGLVFVEAMRQGKPTIACQAGGMPEVVEHGVTGLLVPPGDATSLAQAIERLLEDQTLRTAFGRAGAEAFRRRFTADRMALDSLPLYAAAQASFSDR